MCRRWFCRFRTASTSRQKPSNGGEEARARSAAIRNTSGFNLRNELVDFRYPLAMYFGSVSYFDSHVGTLVSYLKDNDLYDQSLVVVTAPHGEVLAHEKVPYHHLLITPDTIHVPLLMKIPSHLEHRRGSRLSGVFDLIDVFPTIVDMKGLNNNLKLSGTSRWNEIRRGTDIPPHDSFACGFHGLVDSVCRPPYLFSRQRSPGGRAPSRR